MALSDVGGDDLTEKMPPVGNAGSNPAHRHLAQSAPHRQLVLIALLGLCSRS
jgi:hypothetical protein